MTAKRTLTPRDPILASRLREAERVGFARGWRAALAAIQAEVDGLILRNTDAVQEGVVRGRACTPATSDQT